MTIMKYEKDPEILNFLMDIWLNSNLEAHDFIEASYWKNNYNLVRDMINEAEIYYSLVDNKIVAFIGLVDSYIAGIFVEKKYRELGLASSLLGKALSIYDQLSLSVYVKNQKAFNFYLNRGFIVSAKEYDEENKEYEYLMTTKRNPSS